MRGLLTFLIEMSCVENLTCSGYRIFWWPVTDIEMAQDTSHTDAITFKLDEIIIWHHHISERDLLEATLQLFEQNIRHFCFL